MAITFDYADWSPERSRSFVLLRKFNLDRPPFGEPGRKPAKINRQEATIMKFGLFCSAQANGGDLGPETGQGFRDYLDFNVEAEALGFTSSFWSSITSPAGTRCPRR